MRPVVIVLGSVDEPPPRIDEARKLAEIRSATGEDELRGALPGADAVFGWEYDPSLLPSVWDAADDLRWIQTASAGVDRLLFPALVESDVVVTNARGVFDEPIAEWALASILAFATELGNSVRDTVAHRWHHRTTERAEGKRLLVIGPGPIGRAAGRLARGVGMDVEAVGTRARGPEEPFQRIHGPESFHEALGAADYVLDAMPLTPRTNHAFDARAFAAMKPSARFLNVGRGGTVDTEALVDALRRGAIAGAALDVFEEEPLTENHPLWSLPNVIVSPHMAGDVADWEERVVEVFLDNLARFADGRTLRNVIDKERGFGA
ncbi:MAG TPA: D-2-hydroxyacid dehydrogenase [Actinomycetota bacterium]